VIRVGRVIPLLSVAAIGCSQPTGASDNGYMAADPTKSAAVRKAVTAWHDCLVYGIGQVDDPKESSIAVAEAAIAGCTGAETNLEDRLYDAMKGTDKPLEVRAQAHDMVVGFRERMRAVAIRLVLQKHHEERAGSPAKK
jgi:hypothetical protein